MTEKSEILLIVGGGIAAYKSAILARELQRAGHQVQVVLTDAAKRFIGEVTFAGLTSRRVYHELWDAEFSGELHVALADRAKLIVVAPATADLMARAAQGIANDLATATLLCANCPIVFAPAMHERMWDHAATQDNFKTLVARGAQMIGPVEGALANNSVGRGRMEEPVAIAAFVDKVLERSSTRDLQGKKLLITAGPTYEAIDPVRFIGNRSSGKMGVALADAAAARGAEVTFVHGPVRVLPTHPGIRLISVQSAQSMFEAVMKEREVQDAIVMAAAVADYRPAVVADEKIKKGQDELTIRLVKNQDILATLGADRGSQKRPVLVGFAVETSDLVGYARSKLQRKGCDLVVANLASHGFEGDENQVTLVTASAEEALPKMSKLAVAGRIWDQVVRLLRGGT